MDENALRKIISQEIGAAIAPMAEKMFREVTEMELLKRRPLLTPAEVQKVYGIIASTLATKRCRGGGPDYIKEGNASSGVLYRSADIERWLDKNRKVGSL